MFFLKPAFVLLLVFTVSWCESNIKNDTPAEQPNLQKDNDTTTEAPKPTTTPPPQTTTPPPQTTTPPPQTTTPPPQTTTSPSPITTSAPPVHNSEWVVTGINQTVCILAKMNITVKVPYTTTDNQTVVKEFMLNPYNTNSSGNCTYNTSQTLSVIGENITLTFVFGENSTTNNYNVRSVNVSLFVNNYTLPNSILKENLTLIHTTPEFTTPMKMSYTCSNPDAMTLNSTLPSKASLILSNVHIEAFGTKRDRNFSEAMDCNTFETPDIVPIAVGCALAALVIVVLISYLVGRRRSQARGYLSM